MSDCTPPGAPDDLFITDALGTREGGAPDYQGEARAIQAFAIAVADDPQALLPAYVDLALRISGGVSGGLSLWECEPAPGVFRWRFLQGPLSRFEGATTPRNFSPCGVTLDRDEPLLTLHPERFYTWLVDANVALPEVLLVPLRKPDKEPFGTLWVVSDTEGQFTRDHASTLGEIARLAGVPAASYMAVRSGD